MTQQHLPILAVTSGDPAGVGPELCLRLLADARLRTECVPVVLGNAALLERVARQTGLAMPDTVLSPDDRSTVPGVVDLGNLDSAAVQPGRVQAACGRAAHQFITHAVAGVQAGRYDALVTAPIHKQAFALAGVDFPGHTELLQQLTQSPPVAMMLYSERIAVSFVTTHISLRQVTAALSVERITTVTELTANALRILRGREPRLGVCGLNPHAGEQGLLGDEEARWIEPAIAQARVAGLEVAGPLAPDTAFTPEALKRYDGYVAMYHDQGSIPFKMLSFADGVNVTLGLPIIRTSVDHGTAFDIAWQGAARPDSLQAATRLAARLVNSGRWTIS